MSPRGLLPEVSLAAALIVLVAALFYLSAAHWGAPHATGPDRIKSWSVDDETPLGPLAEMHNILEPKKDRNLGYPLLYSFLCAAAYVPYFAYLWLTGQLAALAAAYPFGFADPVAALRSLSWIAHALCGVLAAIAAGATAEAARALASRRAGVLAGLFAATSFPVFYYARTGNVDAPLLAFVALGIAAFARIAAHGMTVGRAAWLGALVGLAVATKEQAAASFLLVPPALLELNRRALGPLSKPTSFDWWRAPFACGVAAVLCFGLGSGLFVDPERYFAHLEFGRERMAALIRGEIAFATVYPFTLEGNLAYARAFEDRALATFTAAGLLLAAAGFALAAARRAPVAWLALPLIGYLAVLVIGARTLQLRYLMPLIPPVAVFAGFALDRALAARQVWLRTAGALLGVLALGLAAARGLDLSHAMWRDSRYAASEWLSEQAQDGDRVAHFGVTEKLPPLAAGIVTVHATPFLGGGVEPPVGPAAVAEISATLRRSRPEFVVLVPDYTSVGGRPYSRSCPPEVFGALMDGSLGYQLSAFFETPSLLPWVARPPLDYPTVNPPIHVFTPVGGPAGSAPGSVGDAPAS